VIKVEKLKCGYGKRTVINDVSFEIKKGSVCGLIGANGAGKSTLIKCIMGYIRPDEGEIFIDNLPIRQLSESDMAKQVAYVSQSHNIPFAFTVTDMVLMGRTPHLGGIYGPKKEDYEICEREIENVGLSDVKDRLFVNLSGGQQQLVVLARAFAQSAPALILDEPTASLDYRNQMRFWEIIREFAGKGKAVLVSLHDPNHAMWFCDRVIALGNNGKLKAQGNPSSVLTPQLLKEVYDYSIDVSCTPEKMSVIVPARRREKAL